MASDRIEQIQSSSGKPSTAREGALSQSVLVTPQHVDDILRQLDRDVGRHSEYLEEKGRG